MSSIYQKSIFRFGLLTGFFLTVVSFQNCGKNNFTATPSTQSSVESSIAATQADCTFNGRLLSEGEQVTAYQTSTVAGGTSCVSEVRKCENKQLLGSFAYASCTAGAPAACLLSGRTIPHNTSVTVYAQSSVAFGASCAPQLRTCQNGVLSGGTGEYFACAVGAAQSCLFNNQIIAHGSSIKAFAQSTVVFGSVCAAQDRVCNNGSLSGNFNFSSCAVGAAASCTFNGKTIAHGATVNAYETSVASPSCRGEVKTCNNGQLSGIYNNSSCTQTSYRWNVKSFVVGPCSGPSDYGYSCSAANVGQQLNQSFCASTAGVPWTCDRAVTTLQ